MITLDIKQEVKEILIDTLYLDGNVDEKTPFSEFGMDSITGVEFIKHINGAFGTNIKQAKLYDYPTVSDLAAYIDDCSGRAESASSLGDDCEEKNDLNLKSKNEIGISAETADATLKSSIKIDIPSAEVEHAIKQLLVRNLYLDEEFDQQKTFSELGIDSITGVEFIRTVNQSLNVNIKQAKLYDYPNLISLSNYVSSLLIDDHSSETSSETIGLESLTPTIIANSSAAENGHYDLTKKVRGILRSTLFLDEDIDETKNFAEMGMDSIIGVEFVKSINQELGINVKQAKLYDYPDLFSLVDYVSGLIKDTSQPAEREQKSDKAKLSQSDQTAVVLEKNNDKLSSKKTTLTNKDPNLEVETKTTKSYELNVVEPDRQTEIAIIGMSARLPGAENTSQFWENLKTGVNSVTEIPSQRWSVKKHYDPDPEKPNKTYSKWGGFLKDIDKFDAGFFNITAFDADHMDPQQRLALEEAYHALENAGYSNRDQLAKQLCGLYIGVMSENEYADMIGLANAAQAMVGNSNAILGGRIAYAFDLKGPVVTLDTACSSSLVSVHMACQSLINGEADMMLAGGVTLYLTEQPHICMSKAMMLSPDGLCKTFDNSADGFVPAEGVGFVVLKPLSKAIRDGDKIHGVIKGSAINQDGKSNGLTAPNGKSQSDLQETVYRKYAIDPSSISYVEAHGTGTKLGDPIEVEALNNSFSKYTKQKQFCAIGSVKSNLGHTSAAAGVTSLIKVLLCLQHKMIPPSLHVSQENEHIGFEDTPFYVNKELQPWRVDNVGQTRIAAINSFGFSGTNAHVVLSEYSEFENSNARLFQTKELEGSSRSELFVLSAKDGRSLRQQAQIMHQFIEQDTDSLELQDIVYTLQSGREEMPYRLAILAESVNELRTRLAEYLGEVKRSIYIYEGRVNETQPLFEVLSNNADEAKLFCSVLIENNKLSDIAKLWVSGLSIKWELLRTKDIVVRKCLSLPGYPFARNRHWISDQNKTILADSTKRDNNVDDKEPYKSSLSEQTNLADSTDEDEDDGVLLQPVWQKTQWSIKQETQSLGQLALVFDNTIDRVEGLFNRSILVTKGDSFKRIASDHYQLCANKDEDYNKLLSSLATENSFPDYILYLWGLNEADLNQGLEKSVNPTASTGGFFKESDWVKLSEDFTSHLNRVVKPLFSLSKSLLTNIKDRQIQLAYLYSSQSDTPHAEHRSMAAFFRTLMQESGSVTGKAIALEGVELSRGALSSIISKENQESNLYDAEVTYTASDRHCLKFQALEESAAFTPTQNQVHDLYRQNGHYLITGGLGGIGWLLAQFLVKNYSADLTLIDVKKPTLKQLEVIKEFEHEGNKVSVKQVALEDHDALAKAMEGVSGVNGVFHLAGKIHPDLIVSRQWGDFVQTINPKTYGTINLDFVTCGFELDFFVSFSSVGSINGGIAYCDYVYANYFIDVYSAYREQLRQAGKRHGISLAINWEFWREGGMVLPDEAVSLLSESLSYDFVSFTDGMKMLQRCLVQAENSSQINQLVALDKGATNWASKLLGKGRAIQSNADQFKHNLSNSKQADSATNTKKDQVREKRVRSAVVEIAKEFININDDELKLDKNMLEYGIDSITRLSLVNRINQELGLSLNAAAALMHETLLELIEHVISLTANETDLNGDEEPIIAESSDAQITERVMNIINSFVSLTDTEIDLSKHMLEYGVDSITRLSIINSINKELSLSLNASAAIMHDSFGELIEHIKSIYIAKEFNRQPDDVEANHRELIPQISSPFSTSQMSDDYGQVWELDFKAGNWVELSDFNQLFHTGVWQEIIANIVLKNMPYKGFSIKSLRYIAPLFVKTEEQKRLYCFFDHSSDEENIPFRLVSQSSRHGDFCLHVRGSLQRGGCATSIEPLSQSEFVRNGSFDITGDEFYEKWNDNRDLGVSVQWVEGLYEKEEGIVARLRVPTKSEQSSQYALGFHPGILESCGQLLFSFLPNQETNIEYWTTHWDGCNSYGFTADEIQYPLWCYAKGEYREQQLVGDFQLFDNTGQLLFDTNGCHLKYLEATSASHSATDEVEYRKKWFSFRNWAAPTPKVRLFCFSYGFGGPSVFFDWQDSLGVDIDVCPVLLPGRETRINETFNQHIEELVDELIEVIKSDLNVPFAFYGHCVGGLIAFLLVRRLEQQKIYPSQLFVAAYPAPLLEPITFSADLFKNLQRWNGGKTPKFDQVSDTVKLKVRDYLKGIMDLPIVQDEEKKPFFDILFPTLLADAHLQQTFNYKESLPVKCPIYAMGSWQDEPLGFTKETMLAWGELTRAEFAIDMFDGNHYFLHPDQEQDKLLNLIKETLVGTDQSDLDSSGKDELKENRLIPSCINDIDQMLSVDENQQADMLNGEMDKLLLELLKANLLELDMLDNAEPSIQYRRWLDQSKKMLSQSDLLNKSSESIDVHSDLDSLWELWEQKKIKWQQGATASAQIVLLETCLLALPDILLDARKSTEVMFPNGSMELVEGIYKENPIADYYNRQLEDAVITYFEARLKKDPNTQFRILEIGAGTGGTTRGILKRLKKYEQSIEEYCYTDLCKAFLVDAEKHYSPHKPYFTTRLYDVESPISGQDIRAKHYDIVIAANVIHATKDIHNTLANAKASMCENALLFMNEISCLSISAHLTFGLLEGWWLYEDTELRMPGCPGLATRSWEKVLNKEGFVLCPSKSIQAYGQQIIIAEKMRFPKAT
ncbi:MAG: acyl transferase domain-containing protein/surfactin synthase thioesterase subunit/acyl carrier protein [Arenicella sp.]|jgi:acyl transferase domain-containing protein/surfactin synthase thioesterase subunit/acyl carrier protein/SAM-dependent methyltransferase